MLFNLIFILSGLSKIGDWDMTISYMESHNMILTPFFLIMAIILQVTSDNQLSRVIILK
ncbi:hypothetical protein [Tenacibaculum ovolyticum]|uniref:hypothetical protein n=1 Tax=Tenacibaculum ovolyticum TaxID=104270 RepID=UPI003A5C32D6